MRAGRSRRPASSAATAVTTWPISAAATGSPWAPAPDDRGHRPHGGQDGIDLPGDLQIFAGPVGGAEIECRLLSPWSRPRQLVDTACSGESTTGARTGTRLLPIPSTGLIVGESLGVVEGKSKLVQLLSVHQELLVRADLIVVDGIIDELGIGARLVHRDVIAVHSEATSATMGSVGWSLP